MATSRPACLSTRFAAYSKSTGVAEEDSAGIGAAGNGPAGNGAAGNGPAGNGAAGYGAAHGWVKLSDGTRLATTLYLPDTAEPVPCLLEALPYRKDDLTESYRRDYLR